MKQNEIHNLRRKNFIEKTKVNFEFLVSELGFNTPKHLKTTQPNGTIIQDKIEYDKKDKKIIILNSYHPADYGFEINLIEKETGETEMLHHVLKESQDVEQSYLKLAAEFLRNSFSD